MGTPICIEPFDSKCRFGRPYVHFVRILVDMDFSSTLQQNVLIERQVFTFVIHIEYENIPKKYMH